MYMYMYMYMYSLQKPKFQTVNRKEIVLRLQHFHNKS